jgi:hypothetical protein
MQPFAGWYACHKLVGFFSFCATVLEVRFSREEDQASPMRRLPIANPSKKWKVACWRCDQRNQTGVLLENKDPQPDYPISS